MARYTSIILGAALITLANSGYCGSDSGFYVGGSLGTAKTDYSVADADFGDIKFDDSNTAYKGFVGFNFGLVPMFNLAVEGSYVDFGKTNPDIAEIPNAELGVSGWVGSGLAGVDLGPVGLFAKVGMIAWDSDFDSAVSAFRTSESGTDATWGLGAKMQLGSFAVRAEYEIFEMDYVEVDFFSVGAAYTF